MYSYDSRVVDGVMDRLNKNFNFQKPFFCKARTPRRTDSTTMLFFRNLFLARRGSCDGQTQQQNYFSETFLFFRNLFSQERTVWAYVLILSHEKRYIIICISCYGWCNGQTQQQCFFSETFFSFFHEARTVWRTDLTTMFFFRNLFFTRRRRCDGQTQQQCFFSETFLRAIGSLHYQICWIFGREVMRYTPVFGFTNF